MATRKNTFLLKRSNVAGNIPTAGQIQLGELALNTADVKLYASGTTTNSILPIGWDRVSRTGDTMTGTLYAPAISATTIISPNEISGATFFSTQSIGDEGGEIKLNRPATNSTISGTVTIDVWQNKLRIFEAGGTNRGGYYDITALASGVGTNLLNTGGSGVTAFTYNNANTFTINNSISATINTVTGFTVNGNLSAATIDQVNYIDFNTGVTVTSDAGRVSWNDVDGTYDMGLYQGVTLQVGQEENVYGKASSAITNGDVVMYNGVQGDHMLFAKADPITVNDAQHKIIGIATQDFTANQFGYVTTMGKIRGLNTLAYSAGTVLYFNSTGTTAGLLTNVEPPAPYDNVVMATVIRSHATQGILFVRPTFRFHLESLENVQVTNVQNNDIIQYSGALGYYVNTNTPKFTSVSATTMSAGTFTGNLTGLASLATSATTALSATSSSGVAITDNTTTNATFYPTFAGGTSGGNNALQVDSSTLTYNPSTNTLTTTNFAGTATNATNVGVTNNTTTNATYYLGFVSATSGNQPLQVDSTTLTFNPSTNTLTVANMSGLASLATSATTALDATNAANIFTSNLPTTNILAYPTFVTGFGSNRNLYTDSSTLTYNPSSNTLTLVNVVATGTITATTISATTYQNLPTDIRVTGGTYATGTATFRNNTGGTFTVTGFNTGTVTSVAALTLGTTGTDLNSTVANGTTTPVITLNVPDASATARGVITTTTQTIAGIKTFTGTLNGAVGSFSQSSAGDTLTGYNGGTGGNGINGGAGNGIGGYFVNNSTTYPTVRLLGLSNTRLLEGRNTSDIATFSVTSTGIVSGSSFVRIGGTSTQFLKADGTVDSTTYVPTSRTITINGVAQDLSVNRSWTIATGTGTVTQVNSGNGMNFTNFTTSGTITMGTPSSTTLASTNATTTNSHTHAFAPGGTTGQYITGAGTLVTFPTIPTVNDGTLTLATSGIATGSASFTANQAGASTFTVNVPATDLSIGVSSGTQVRVDSSTGADVDIPVASATLAGIVTTGAQTFAGTKTFSSTISGSINGNAATADNATSADKIDNINFRNSNQTSPISAPDTLDSNGVGYVTNINLYGQIDGALYAQAYSSAWQHQIFGDYRTGQLAVRGKNSGTWQSWRNILDSTNFTNYAVPTGRTLTINGTTFDLSANRSWTITSGGFTGGTVTGPTNFTAGVTANTISATTVTVDTLNATNITGIGGLQNYVAKFSANGPFIGNSQIYDNGTSVGINTTSPSSTSKLDVNGVIRGIYMADPTTGETTAKFLSYSPSPYGLIFRGYSSGAHSIQSQREGNDTQLYPLSLQPLGGSVGINTTTPTVPLDVNGEALVRGPFTVSGSPTTLQYVRVNSDMDLFNSHVDSENYGTFSRLRLSRASGTQIAPTTPASGTAVGRLEFGAYNSGTGTFIMNAKVEAVMDATTGANDLPSRLSFFTTPDGSTTMAEVMRVNSLGNMRIGGLTMALSDVINVENGSVAFQNGYGLRFQSTGGTLYASVYSNNNDTVIKSLGDAIRFKNRAGTANRMSILDGGFVGINTNTPNQWLDVNGDALINGLTVGLGNSAYNNAVLGNQALGANTTGYNNVAIHSALPLNTTGTNNVGVGYKALFINTIGNDNVAVGVGSLQLNTSGEKNISIGSNSSYNNDNGQANIAIGANALFTNVNSSSNVAVGYNALYTNTGGANLALGHYAGYTLDGDGNNIIGTSNNQLPDANDLSNQSNTLSISKHTQITKGMPHFWAPDSISISPGAGYVLEADPLAYSAVFIDYSLEDQNGNLRAGTLKAIFNVTLATIKWDEVATSDIGSTSNYTFDFMDNGSGILGVELTNSGGVTVYCNLTSRLVSRTIL